MIGAIIGDIVGSRFEFNNTQDEGFNLFDNACNYTDDTICTIAVADAIIKDIPVQETLLDWCRKYPHPMGGYGASFNTWMHSANPTPYNSFGNGAAMRVSPCGWAGNDTSDVLRLAIGSATCTHNHVDGIIGAQAVALGIFKARTPNATETQKKSYLRDVARLFYGPRWYDSTRIPKRGVFDETCQGCVPLAFRIVMHANDFEDAIRKAVAYGGDSDTLAAIVGAIAEPLFGIPTGIVRKALAFLPDEMYNVVTTFKAKYDG